MGDFDSVFDQLTAYAKVSSNFLPRSAQSHQPSQHAIGRQRRCADSIGCLFVSLVVISRQQFSALVMRNRGQTVRRMPEKDMRNFFH